MSDRSSAIKSGSRVRLGLASDEWLVACVRRGDTAAFETLYDRHVRELLGFCVYMLGSRQDAEDAVQATFASAYRALRADTRPVMLRPWLFTIARNDCLSILRRRRPVVELDAEIAKGPDPLEQIEQREEVRRVFEGLRGLPENQRAALVLAEVHGLSHQEVGAVLGVRAEQVKAFVFQARSKLVSERAARDADCREIREELASARGAALLRARLRRHMRACPDCRAYATGMARQRRQLGALLPIAPSLGLKYRALEEALGLGSSDPVSVAGGATVGAVAGTAAEFAGGGFNALLCKVAAGMVCLGASAGVGVSVLSGPEAPASVATNAAASTPTRTFLASVTPRRLDGLRGRAGVRGRWRRKRACRRTHARPGHGAERGRRAARNRERVEFQRAHGDRRRFGSARPRRRGRSRRGRRGPSRGRTLGWGRAEQRRRTPCELRTPPDAPRRQQADRGGTPARREKCPRNTAHGCPRAKKNCSSNAKKRHASAKNATPSGTRRHRNQLKN